MDRLLALMLIFVGGGLGSLTRLLLDFDSTSPFLIANFASCFLIGISYAITRYKVITHEYYTNFVNVGFLGGLSTFTPLATWSIVESSEISTLLSVIYLLGLLALFLACTVVTYSATAAILKFKYGLKPKPSVSLLQRAYILKENIEQQRSLQEAIRKKEELAKAERLRRKEEQKKRRAKAKNAKEAQIVDSKVDSTPAKKEQGAAPQSSPSKPLSHQVDDATLESFAALAQLAQTKAQEEIAKDPSLDYNTAFNRALQNLINNAAQGASKGDQA